MTAPGDRLAARVEFGLDELLAVTRGELASAGGPRAVRGIATDSRTLEPGEAFVAIRGERHDGHAWIGAAVARGAGAVIVQRGVDLPARVPASCTVIVVRDTLAALGDLARWHRRRRAATVLAVAGSNGKTTTKEMVAAICRAAVGSDAVLATRGTQNNLVGLPLTLLRLGDERVAVVELGMNHPGELWRLTEIADPDVGVITCVGPEHLEGVGSIRGAAEAEGELFRRLRPSAVAIVNADDPWVRSVAASFPGRRIRFATEGEGEVRARDIHEAGLDGSSFRLWLGGSEMAVRLAIPGRHNVSNALAAAAMAYAIGVDPSAVRAGLEAVETPGMRMQVVRLPGELTVLNDAYNANPASMAAALATLASSPAGRRLAALGEMRELGAAAAEAHEELGRLAARAGVDRLYLLGPLAEIVSRGARDAGLPAEAIVVAADHADLAARLRADCRPGDLVLLKGSRGAAMETVLAHLAAT